MTARTVSTTVVSDRTVGSTPIGSDSVERRTVTAVGTVTAPVPVSGIHDRAASSFAVRTVSSPEESGYEPNEADRHEVEVADDADATVLEDETEVQIYFDPMLD